jgi:hypothetical protein
MSVNVGVISNWTGGSLVVASWTAFMEQICAELRLRMLHQVVAWGSDSMMVMFRWLGLLTLGWVVLLAGAGTYWTCFFGMISCIQIRLRATSDSDLAMLLGRYGLKFVALLLNRSSSCASLLLSWHIRQQMRLILLIQPFENITHI